MANLKKDCQVESDHFVLRRIDKADEIGIVLMPLEGPEELEMEFLLEDNAVVVFIDVAPGGIFAFDLRWDWVDAIKVLIGVSVECYLLGYRDG